MSDDIPFTWDAPDVNDQSHAAGPTLQRAKVAIQLWNHPTMQSGAPPAAGKGRRGRLPKSIAFMSACGLPFPAKNPETWWLIRERVASVSN
jgi:hypothetical protein